MTVTLADIKAAQKQHRELLTVYAAKCDERDRLYAKYQELSAEIDSMNNAAHAAKTHLRQLGAEFALQVEGDHTPKLPGMVDPVAAYPDAVYPVYPDIPF